MSFETEKQTIQTVRTARFFMLGKPGPETNQVWIVLHGYGQHAQYFLRKFKAFASAHTVIVAPEGLSRFYISGASGKVGASWMTSEDRLDEIEDYIAYLNNVVADLNLHENCDINVLGFSQGAATLTRWVNACELNFKKVVFYAGVFPPDVSLQTSKKWEKHNCWCVIGTNDQYYSAREFEKTFAPLKAVNNHTKFIEFEGGHEINTEVLRIFMAN